MLKKFLTLLCLLGAINLSKPAFAQMQNPQSNTNVFPVVNSLSQATNNSTLIQNALNAGGWVIVQCPTAGTVYLGSTLYMKSNTHLTMSQSCTPTGISGTYSLLANWASSITNVPWTTTQLNTVITNGPLSIIYSGNTPAWSNNSGAGTAYVKGNYVVSAGNIYWESATSCTGATTVGPTGTGSGISDGTCSWNYVTTSYVLGVNPATWAISTAFSESGYTVANGNVYWNSYAGGSTCTSASSGSGPTGTGSGISDGTCVWNYIASTNTISLVGNAGYTATVYWPSHGQVVGNAAALTPVPDNPGTNNFWSGTQTAGTNGALADSAYFGVFPIVMANDSNWITVALNRQPQTAFSAAPMRVKQADENIIVDGGANWNYNYPTNTASGSGNGNVTSMDIVMAWVENLNIDGLNLTNSYKYGLYVIATNADINHVIASNTNSDRIKIYGPSSAVTVENSYGPGGADDIVSLQPQDVSAFATYLLGCGDVNSITLRHLTSDSGLIVAVYATHQYLKIDDILIDDFLVRNSVASATYRGAVALVGGGTVTSGTPLIGNIKISRGVNLDTYAGMPLVSLWNGGTSFTVNNLVIDGGENPFGSSFNTVAGSVNNIFSALSAASGVTVNRMTVKNIRANVGPTNSTTDAVINLQAGTFGEIDFDDSYVNAIVKGNGFGIYLNGATVDHIGIHNNYFQDLSAAARLFTATNVDLVGNHLAQSSVLMSGIVVNVTGTTENIDHNYASGITGGLVRVNGTFTQTVRSDGQNTMLGGSLLYVPASGTPVTTLLGGTDIAAVNTPAILTCTGCTLGTGSNNVSGTLTLGAGLTTGSYSFTTNAYPTAPRGCIAVPTTAGAATSCTITWASASSGSFQITDATTAGTVNYQILP